MSERPDIPMLNGATDDAYGTRVWLSRVNALASHIRVIRNHLPEGAMGDWLRRQCDAGLKEAELFSRDAVPSDADGQP